MKKVYLLFSSICVVLFLSLQIYSQNSVKIGDQTWMITNLNVSKFRNGDPIPEVKSNEEWEKAGKNKQPAWCYYDNNSSNGVKYGKLYNWWAVNDPRGLAPEGWHVPDAEEVQLLFKNGYGDGDIFVPELKSKSGWSDVEEKITCPKCEGEGWYFQSTCIRCKGNQEISSYSSGNGDNSSGFSALPGGNRIDFNGEFEDLGEEACFWMSKESCHFHITESDYFASSKENYKIGRSAGYGHSVRCIKDSKEYLDKIANETKLQDEETRIKAFEKEFDALLSKGSAEENFEYIKKNKAAIFAIFDNNKVQVSRIARTAHSVLISVLQELIKSIDENEGDRFEYTKSFFKIVESQDFQDLEKKIYSLIPGRYDDWNGDSYSKLKNKVAEIDKFISFKNKIRKLKYKNLTDLEKNILGNWKFTSKEGKNYILNLKEGREIEIAEVLKKSGEFKTGLKTSKYGGWEFDGEVLTFYPEWDCISGVYTEMKATQKKLKSLSDKIEPKFLTGETFSIKHYKKAFALLKEVTLDYRIFFYSYDKSEFVYLLAMEELKKMDIQLALLISYNKKIDKEIETIAPLQGKNVRLDLPNIRKKVEEMRNYYLGYKSQLEKSQENVSNGMKYMFEAEQKNSSNLAKTDLEKFKLRVEGDKAFFEGIEGERIK
jgi:uncharacterized protein (TIGR02145 family)